MDKSTIICPHCQSARVAKRDKRIVKYGTTQIYVCKKCRKIFSASPLPAYTYPPQAIIAAPMYYYRGYSLREIKERMHGTFHVDPSLAAIHAWIRKFGRLAGMKKEREAIQGFALPHKLIWKKMFTHQQTYLTQVHRYKLEHFTQATPGIREYISGIMQDKIIINPESFAGRASMTGRSFPFPVPWPRENYACNIADFALRSAATNHQRHTALQNYFIAVAGPPWRASCRCT